MQLALANGGSLGGNGAAAAPPPPPPRGVLSTLVDVYRTGGAGALFSGVAPRSLRAAPACALVIGCYELLKSALSVEEEEQVQPLAAAVGGAALPSQPPTTTATQPVGDATAAAIAGRRGAPM